MTNTTVHFLRDGKAACGSRATKALDSDRSEVTCYPCKAIADRTLVPMIRPPEHPWLVVVTFAEGEETDIEVFTLGAGSTGEDATAWADRFQRWWDRNAVAGGRTIEHMLITRASDPSFVDDDLVAEDR